MENNKDQTAVTPRICLDEHQSKQLLKTYQIPVVAEHPAVDADQAVTLADNLGYPVVVKGLGQRITHKTERNLVHLNLNDADAVKKACARIRETAGADLTAFLVQPMLNGRRELMAGFHRDKQFGPVVAFGLGGVLAEVLNDVVLGLAPLSEKECRAMLTGLKAKQVLAAFRGEPAVQEDQLVAILSALSLIAEDHPDIAEIDINPLIVLPDGGLCAVDALVVRSQTVVPAPIRPPVDVNCLYRLFHPRSIVFVGASSQMGKWGHLLTVNTINGGYKGALYFVNAKGGVVAGQPVYKRVQDIPADIDLAVVTIPSSGALDIVAACHEKQIRRMVMITSGFGEIGDDGRKLEEKVARAARDNGMLILGPNTMGIANPHIDLFCTGATVTPCPGGTAMVSQSGNMGTQLLAFAEKQGLGIRCFAGSGNEAMIAMEDYLACFEQDNLTRSVMLYAESVVNGRRFFENARRIGRTKPIVLLKGGQTDAGGRAAASHTGALASDSRVFDAMCRQAGIIKVEHPMDLLDLAAAFASLPLPKGPRTAIMTWGGGWGVITADLCRAGHLTVPCLDADILEKIDALLPAYWSRTNPVDMVGEHSPDAALKTLEALMAWQGCDAVINLGILGRRKFLERFGQAALRVDPDVTIDQFNALSAMLTDFESRFVERAVELMHRYHKPVLGVSLIADEKGKTVYRIKNRQDGYNAVFYETPERAVTALSKMAAYQLFRSQ